MKEYEDTLLVLSVVLGVLPPLEDFVDIVGLLHTPLLHHIVWTLCSRGDWRLNVAFKFETHAQFHAHEDDFLPSSYRLHGHTSSMGKIYLQAVMDSNLENVNITFIDRLTIIS